TKASARLRRYRTGVPRAGGDAGLSRRPIRQRFEVEEGRGMAGAPRRKISRLASQVLLATLLLLGPIASEAHAAIAFLKTVGTNNSKTLGTSLAVTLAAGVSVPAGHTLIVSFATDPGAGGAVTCADNRGNVYTKDADVTNGTLTTGVRAVVFSAPIATAL